MRRQIPFSIQQLFSNQSMALIKAVRGIEPQFGEDCFLAENATIVGDFICGSQCSFWFNSVVRADVNSILLGNEVNVQDGAVIHCTYKKSKTIIGNRVSIGHNAIVHGCTIEDNVLIGMGAIIMDHAVVKSGSIIAAGAVVLENSIVEANSIYAGVPAKKIKNVDSETSDFFIRRTAENYIKYSSWFTEQ